MNGVDIDERLNDDMQKTNLTTEIRNKLKTVTHIPKDKWVQSQTSKQKIDWYVEINSL